MLHQVDLWRDLNQGWCTLCALHCTSSLLVPPLLPGPVMSCWVRAVPLLLHISIYTTPASAGCQLQYKMTHVTLQALALSGFPDTQKPPVVSCQNSGPIRGRTNLMFDKHLSARCRHCGISGSTPRRFLSPETRVPSLKLVYPISSSRIIHLFKAIFIIRLDG